MFLICPLGRPENTHKNNRLVTWKPKITFSASLGLSGIRRENSTFQYAGYVFLERNFSLLPKYLQKQYGGHTEAEICLLFYYLGPSALQKKKIKRGSGTWPQKISVFSRTIFNHLSQIFAGQHWLQLSSQIQKICPVFWSAHTYNFAYTKFASNILKKYNILLNYSVK